MTELADLNAEPIEGYLPDGREVYVPLISPILPGLYMGGCRGGAVLPASIDFIVALYDRQEYRKPLHARRLMVRGVADSHHVPDVSDAVQQAYDRWWDDKNVLIHCQAGLNRSGLVTAQVLMRSGLTAQAAIDLLRARRSPLVLCNRAFEAHLLEKP